MQLDEEDEEEEEEEEEEEKEGAQFRWFNDLFVFNTGNLNIFLLLTNITVINLACIDVSIFLLNQRFSIQCTQYPPCCGPLPSRPPTIHKVE